MMNTELKKAGVSLIVSEIIKKIGEGEKYVIPITDTIFKYKVRNQIAFVNAVEALAPGFEKFSDDFFKYLADEKLLEDILSNTNFTAEEKKELIQTVQECKKDTTKIIVGGVVVTIVGVTLTVSSAIVLNKHIEAEKAIKLAEELTKQKNLKYECIEKVFEKISNVIIETSPIQLFKKR